MVSRLGRILRAVSTPLVMLAAVILGLTVPDPAAAQARCGGENQTPCTIFQRIPSCNTGLKEDFAQRKCVKMATPCGAAGERPCLLTERVLSCNPGSYEDFGKNLCVKTTPCGGKDQRPCRIEERIPSCDRGLYEDMGAGKCFIHGDYLRDGFKKCVHVPGVSDANGVQLRTWDCGAKMAHMTWERVPMLLDFNDTGDGGLPPFWLKNRLTGKCAAVHAGQKDEGTAVIQWDCGPGKNFQWGWDSDGQIVHRESQKCLHSESGGHNVPLTITQCAKVEVPKSRQWTYTQVSGGGKLTPDLTDENHPGYLKNGVGPCLQVPEGNAEGAQLTTWLCDPNLRQVLWVRETGITVDWAYEFFKNGLNRMCLAVHAGQKHDGAWVIQGHCGGEPGGQNFHWQFKPGNQLFNRESGKCLEIVARKAVLATCAEIEVPNNKLWTLVKPNGEEYR